MLLKIHTAVIKIELRNERESSLSRDKDHYFQEFLVVGIQNTDYRSKQDQLFDLRSTFQRTERKMTSQLSFYTQDEYKSKKEQVLAKCF